ncbi:MAG: hypothetical protein Tsb0032_41050 [Kiloniellaceae bacterium]
MQKIILGVLAIIAIAGWALAYDFHSESGDLSRQLAGLEAEQVKTTAALEAARSDLKEQAVSAGSLEEVQDRLGAAEADAAALDEELQRKQSELAAATKATEDRRLELSEVERQLVEQSASLETVRQEAERAAQEVERLRAESVELAQMAQQLRRGQPAEADPEGSTTAAPGETMAKAESVSEMPAADQKNRMEQMFHVLDMNGDAEIDELEFRLNSIKLLGVIDSNGDGFVTPNETLLSPDRFSRFDENGDRKIAPVEFVEAFRVIDGDSGGTITLQDYTAFVEGTSK